MAIEPFPVADQGDGLHTVLQVGLPTVRQIKTAFPPAGRMHYYMTFRTGQMSYSTFSKTIQGRIICG